jgi:pyruvate/2-oxoglutarate dehydrogenase complex dihydrolipoamide acyltransferase (E2) component
MPREFKLPDLGEGIAEGQIVRVLIKEGDNVNEDQALMEVETDKAAVEIPSPYAGQAQKVHVKEGDTVKVGQVLVTFSDDGETAQPRAAQPGAGAEPKEADKRRASSEPQKPTAEEAPPSRPKDRERPTRAAPQEHHIEEAPRRTRAAAAPAVRRLARELGVDIDSLTGTGPGGRVRREDVEAAAGRGGESRMEAPRVTKETGRGPQAPPTIEGTPGKDNYGPVKRAKLTQIRKTIAAQMVRAAAIPAVTQTDEADVTQLEQIRRELRGPDGKGPRVTLMAFVLKTLAHALKDHPIFNSSFDAEKEEIVYKEYINIGVAVDSPRGLVVPVIRGVDQLSVWAIAQELGRVAERVRNVQFGVDELRGGTFTVTNYGAIGGIWGTPIINHPEVAILGLGRVAPQLRLGEDEEEIEVRQILPLSLTFDHRAADGAQAARFLNDVVAHLSDPALLLIK